MNKLNIYEKINQQVIAGLKKSGMAWFKPWKSGQANMPMNYATTNYYRGMNIFMLNAVMMNTGWKHNQWMTYKQAQDKGGQVKTGEKSTMVYFFKIGFKDNDTGNFYPTRDDIPAGANIRETFALRYYNVFNIAQTEGLEPIVVEAEDNPDNEPIEVAEKLTKGYLTREKIKFTQDGSGAYYRPSEDQINMPPLDTFCDSDSYYKVLYHEMAHSTGHESRLKRATLMEFTKWGDETYAREELVAEISAMYLVGLQGLEPHDSVMNSQAYIKGWCKQLEDKPRECVTAMQQATKVVDFILG